MTVDPSRRPGGMPRFLRRFVREQRGNVLMIVGLSIIPLTFATGMAIDYTQAMRLQTKVNAIADASALASTTTPMLKQTLSQACTVAQRTFASQISGLNGLSLNTGDPNQLSIVITEKYASQADITATCGSLTAAVLGSLVVPLQRTTTVTYHATSANSFSGILNRANLPIAGVSTSVVSTAPYINIHVALDASQSMGLASTSDGATQLWNETLRQNGAGRGCQFGCHVVQTPQDQKSAKNPISNEQIAKNIGVQLRIDVLRSATQNMIQTAQTDEKGVPLYQFALYSLGLNGTGTASNTATISNFSPLTSNLTQSYSDATSIDLGPNNAGGTGDTSLPAMLSNLSPTSSSPMRIQVHGDGTTQAKARAFLFIITDGVTDILGGSCTSGHCTAPIDPTQCQQFKDNNVTIGVVYTTYLPILANPNNGPNSALDGNYISLVKSFSNAPGLSASDIPTRLQACASPGWYFEASDGPSIQTAINNLFTQASKTPVITR